MRTVLFVCTGNTCRSPMAEAMFKQLAREAGLAIEVRSAGVSAVGGYPVSPHAAEALRSRRLQVPGPSRSLTEEQIAWADLILTMTLSHKRAVIRTHPDAAGKTYTLKEFALQGEAEMGDVAEAERLLSEMQIRQSMGQSLDEADRARLEELQRKLPNFDIADPFGGSRETYERSALEIEDALHKIVHILKRDAEQGAD